MPFCWQGGMKAQIWSSIFQLLIVAIGLIVFLSMTAHEAGGAAAVYEKALDGGRLFWNEYEQL